MSTILDNTLSITYWLKRSTFKANIATKQISFKILCKKLRQRCLFVIICAVRFIDNKKRKEILKMKQRCKLEERMFESDYKFLALVLLLIFVFGVMHVANSFPIYFSTILIISFILLALFIILYKWKENKETSLDRLILSKKTWVRNIIIDHSPDPELAFLNLCLAMNSEKTPHSICQKCVKDSLAITEKLFQESREKVNSAIKLGLYEQAVGAREQLAESLPYPIRMLLINKDTLSPDLVIQRLKEQVTPDAKLFLPNPDVYRQCELNVADLDVNIPLKGLKFLESLLLKGGKKRNETSNRKKEATNKTSIPQFFESFPNNP